MAIRAGLSTPSIESVADSIPSIESISQSIENVPSTSELAQSNLDTIAGLQATTDAIGYEPPDETPQVFYSPSTKKMFVNGLMFDDDDARTALQSVAKLKDRPLKPSLNVARDWIRVGPKEFGSYIKGIKNPQAGRLAAENFDIGGSNLKLLYGRAAQFFGAEDYGQRVVDEAVREIEKNEPFQREFTNIKGGYIRDGDANESHDAIDWFVANLAQQGPNLIESVAAALVGGVIGGVTSANPLSAVGYAVSGVLNKERYKQAVINAARKYEKDRTSLTSGERKLLRESASLAGVASIKTPNILVVDSKGVAKLTRGKPTKNQLEDLVVREGLVKEGGRGRITQAARDQAIRGGSAVGIGTSSYGIGLGDVYGEQREQGQDDRVSAALTAIPYAAFEMLPEFLLAARIFNVNPNKVNKTLLKDADKGGKATRVLKGFGVGGTLEGTTEVAQESLVLANTGQLDLNSPQVQNRLTNAFAAGFFVGGPIGGVANLLAKPSTDILTPNNPRTEPNDAPIDLRDDEVPRDERVSRAKEQRDTILREQMKLPASAYNQETKEVEKETNKIIEETGKQTLKEKGTRDFPIAVISDTKDLEKENTNLLNRLDKQTATTETEDTATGTNIDEAIANILKNNTKKEIKNVEQDLKKATTTTTTPKGKAKLTSADKLNTMLEEISTLDRVGLSRYELKSSAKVKGKRRNIASYLAMDQGLAGRTNTEELSKIRAKKIETKVRLEKAGKINTAQYRNVVADIAAIDRYLSLLVTTTETGVEKRGSDAGEEAVINTEEDINALRKQQQEILDRAIAEQEAATTTVATTEKGDTQDAVQERSPEKVDDGKQTTTGEKVSERNTEEQKVAEEDRTEKPSGKKETRENKLQVKKEEDTTGQTGKKRLKKPADSTGQDNVVNKFLQQQKVERLTKARAKPKDVAKKYKSTQEAWDDIKPLIAGSTLIDTIPKTISDSIDKAVKEGTEIKSEEVRNMFLHMVEQDFIDIDVTPGVYTNMRIEQYEAAAIDNDTKQDLLSELLDIGWLDKRDKLYGDTTFTKAANENARNFLNNYFAQTGLYTDNEAAVLDGILFERLTTKVSEVGDTTGLSGIQSGSELRIKEAIAWTKRRGTYKSIIEQRQRKKLPVLTGAEQALETDQREPSETTISEHNEPEYTAIKVHDLIKNQITEAAGTTPIMQPKRSRPKKRIEDMYAELSDEDKNYGINKEGNLLSDYFDDKGKLVVYRTTSAENTVIFKPTTKQTLKEIETRIETEKQDKAASLKKEEKKLTEYAIVESNAASGYSLKTAAEAEAKDLSIENTFMAASLSEAKTYMKNYLRDPLFDISLDDKPKDTPQGQAFLTKQDLTDKDIDDILADVDDNPEDTMFYRLDGSVIKNSVPILRVRAIVNKALSKLQLKPKATVVKDKAELESKFPELYERAVAGRQQGDFDTTNFAAFALGDEIVVFADNIKTEEQLKFIVAHETLGHFGLRAFVPDGKLNAVLEDLYNKEGHIRAIADRNIDNGMDKYMAIEEAMANAAATLDASALQRVWFAVKNFLNKIGIKFDDDLSRYILSQSRRNLRTGGGSYFNVKQLVSNMQDEYNRATQTRFYTEQNNTSLVGSIMGMFGITANNTTGSFSGFKDIVKNKMGLDVPRAIGSALEYLQTLGNISTRSEGLRSIFNIFGMQAKKIKSLERTYETLTQFSTKPNLFDRAYDKEVEIKTTKEYEDLIADGGVGSGVEPGAVGATNLELNQAGDLMSYAALNRAKQNGEDSTVANASSLRLEGPDGQVVNREVAKELGDMGIVPVEEFIRGLEFDVSIPNEEGAPTTQVYKPDFVITPRVYKIYLEMRTAINKSAVDVFESSLESTSFERQDAIDNFLKSIGQDSNLTGARETFELIMEKYRQIRQEGASGNKQTEYTRDAKDKSALFIREVNRALFEPRKLEDWESGQAGIGVKENYSDKNWNDETKKPTGDPRFAFPVAEYSRIIEGLRELNGMFRESNKGSDEANTITNTIKSLFALEEATKQTEFNSKRTLMTGYVQFVRRGKYQIETVAFDKNRNRVKLDQQYKNSMPYFQAETAQDAREIRDQVNKTFGKNSFVVKDKSGQEIEVTLEAATSVARTAALMSLDQNLSAFLRIADNMQINISVNDRDKIIKGLTDTGSAARKKLPRVGKPGWNKEVVRNQAMFLRAQSHLAGKTYFEHKLNTVLASEDQWLGDRDKLNRLKQTLDRVEESGNPQEIQLAREAYDEYAQMYRYSAAATGNPADDVTIYEMTGPLANVRTPKQVKPEGRGEDYRQQAQDLLGYYASGENIVDSTEDILENTKAGQNLRVLAVSSQLGGSIATALINTMSMVTHSIPYLATYNPHTGYGGGFGLSASMYEMQRAAREMGDATRTRLGLTEAGAEQSLANLDWMNKVAGYDPETKTYTANPELAEQLQRQYNISPDEAQAIHKATSDGVLQAAQYNALVGTARGGLSNTTSGLLRKWMSLFSYTEQLNRRATFLAAYRLQKAKLQAANADKFRVEGMTEERIADLNKEIEGLASKFAETAVNTSQGEYSMFNRPKISRGPLLNSLMMYKQFVMISIELMRNLGRNERIYFLALLFLLSGMKGLPFAEDIMDLIDTLLQIFGIKMGTVEKELNMLIEEVAPGASPIIMKGFIDATTGATMSTRLGFGDLVPLTGVFKAGSDFGQETKNFLGPVYAAGEQAVSSISLLGNFLAGGVGIKDDTTRFVDVLRAQPFGGIRAIADAYTYYDDGVITNKQGKVLDKDVHFKEIFFRALNFYPATASYQNDIIRMTKQTGEYVKSFKIKFSEAYVKARISGDRAEMRRIERAVREHNRNYRKTEFYIPDWKASANRMYNAWKLPAAARFKKFSAKSSRPDIEKLIEAYDM